MNNLQQLSRPSSYWRIQALVATLVLMGSVVQAANLGDVMPLGDSVTLGVGDPAGGGYRDPLYTRLTNAGHTFQFVGTASGLPTALLTGNGQQNHEGHSGYVIEAGTSGRPGIRDNIAAYLGATNPNIIALMIGTNDVNLNYQVATAPGRLSDLLTDINTLEPNAHTIVANLVPVQATSGALFNRVAVYNAAVPGVVATHQGLGHKVSFLDMHSFLTAPGDLNDSLHPNATGYDNMAIAWEAGINALLAVPAVPEPSGMTLGVLAVLGVACSGWRRRRHR